MRSTSRYRQIRYRAQGVLSKHYKTQDGTQAVLLKHHQIQDGTHAVLLKHYQIQYRAQRVHPKHRQIRYMAQEELSKQGCEHVHQRDNFLSRYAPLNFIKKRRADETLCFRVRCSIQATSTTQSPEWMCAHAIDQLRQLLTTRQKEQYLRCEVRLFLRTGQQHCFRDIKNGIPEVACA